MASRALADVGVTFAGVICAAVAASSAAASAKVGGIAALDLERRAFAFGMLALVILLLGIFSEGL